MKNFLLIVFLLGTANGFASECKSLLKATESSEASESSEVSTEEEGDAANVAQAPEFENIDLSEYEEASTPAEIIALVNKEILDLQKSLKPTHRINSWYKARNWFRERLGAGARRQESRIAAKLLRLKEAVRKGDQVETWKIVDIPFLKAETAFLWTYKHRRQILALERRLQSEINADENTTRETQAGIRRLQRQIKTSEQGLKTHLRQLINSYKEYKALRLFLEYEARNPLQGRQDFAKSIFKKVGLDHHGLKEYEGIREILNAEFPDGIPLNVMGNEVSGKNYDAETERPLKDFGRMYSLRSQTIRLGLSFGANVVTGLVPNITKLAEGFAQGARSIPKVGPFIAPVFEIFTTAINDIEAVRYHLVDILTVEAVYSNERPDQLSSVMSQYGRFRSMVFLTNMARSFEHKMLLWEINARMALEGSGETYKLEQFLLDRTAVEDLRIEVSILQKDLERIRNGINITGEPLKVNDENEAAIKDKLQEKIKELEALETGAVATSESEASKIVFNQNLQDINSVVESRLSDLTNPKRSSSQPVGQYALMIKIRQAQERAIEMPPLSYSVSAGSVVRNAAFNAALYFAVGYFIFWTDVVPEDIERAFVDAVIPDMLGR